MEHSSSHSIGAGVQLNSSIEGYIAQHVTKGRKKKNKTTTQMIKISMEFKVNNILFFLCSGSNLKVIFK